MYKVGDWVSCRVLISRQEYEAMMKQRNDPFGQTDANDQLYLRNTRTLVCQVIKVTDLAVVVEYPDKTTESLLMLEACDRLYPLKA